MTNWTSRFSLQGKTALVTGASRGIGFEICEVFADAGANIIAVARDEAALQQVAKAVQLKGQSCDTRVCDLQDSEQITTLCDSVLKTTTVDILVNNAGVALVNPALDITIDDWERSMSVNLRAPFLLSQRLAPKMIEQKWGKIINISSQAAVISFENHAAYSASKAGLNGLTRALMCEWAQYNIQVNAICPTVILTDMGVKVWGAKQLSEPFIAKTPARRFGEQVEVADMALYLASDASALVNGETLMLDGGYSAV